MEVQFLQVKNVVRPKAGPGLAPFETFPLNNLALRFLPLQLEANLSGGCSHRAVAPTRWDLT